MRVTIWLSLARSVLLESLRRKDLWVVAILGLVIMLSGGALGFFGIQGLEVFAKDLAVSVLGLFSTVAAVLTTSRLMPDELRNRTLYPLLARPITRFDLLVGKLLGAIVVTWIAFLLLALLTSLALATFRVGFEPIMLQYVLFKMLGLAVLCAVTLALSLFMTPAGASTMSFVLAFGSTMISRGLLLSYENASPALQPVFKLVDALLPRYGHFDLGSRAANVGWAPVPLWVVLAMGGYALVYASAMLVLSWSRFRRQAI